MNFLNLTAGWHRLLKRVRQTGDSEPEQAIKIRLSIGVLLVLYYSFPWSADSSFSQTFYSLSSLIALNYYLMAIVLALAIIRNPRPSPVRRVLGIMLDLCSLSAVMFLAGSASVPLFVLYLWVILGNGFRYGTRYLYISLGIGLAGFMPAITWGSYWQHNQSIAVSLLIILCVLPLYAAFLLNKLHDAIDSAKQANQAKSRFLANMSHELRTPLNGVIGMGDLLRETSLTYDQHELVNSMHSSANTLLELIENVLDISKIEAGKLHIDSRPFDLHALINSVRYMLAPMGETKGLKVSINVDPDTPYSLIGDQPHIRQVLINLISNAIKFTDMGSVNLNVFSVGGNPQKPRIRFEIKDTGIGISEKDQQRIFENFTQADASSSRSYGGTGLGTTISRDLVDLMGGDIGLISELDSGSTFWFELPFEAMPATADKLSTHRVLLLADEETAAIVRPSLKSWQVEFDWVRSSARALSLLINAIENDNSYDIIIVDQGGMHDVSPVQFAQMIKAEDELDAISMILINSSDSMIETNIVNQYYISTLQEPNDKRQLFNSIHAAQSVHFTDSNVVTLAEHYARQGQSGSLNILVAEDNRVNQKVVEGILKHAGHTVILTANGEEALDILSSKLDKIDLLILDMNMPQKSGIEVVKSLRFMDTQHPIPVIMLTADATPEARERSIQAGANSFMTKPIDSRVLLEKVAILTRNKGGHKKNAAKSHAAVLRSHAMFNTNASPWFDENVLQELSNLGDGSGFIIELIKGFEKDGSKHLQGIRKFENDDYPAYRECLHALKGSATELGATVLAEICLKGEAMKPYDMGTEKLRQLNREIENSFKSTVSALHQAVSETLQQSPGNNE